MLLYSASQSFCSPLGLGSEAKMLPGLKTVFGKAEDYKITKIQTDRNYWRKIEKLTAPKKISIKEKELTLIEVFKSTETIGYVVYTAERGQHKPIYYAVYLTPAIKIKNMEVIKYSESFGFEIKSPEFLKQYRDKTIKDKFTISQDIDSINGATISVESTNRAAKKALAILTLHIRLKV